MFNNRMLAVAAVLVMAVPALGAATPIVVPPVPEQLVEGHTVFTVIEILANTATNVSQVRFAAAVAVLVREYSADAERNAQRFPGVLWFNDQYLVNPTATNNDNDGANFRYPCGGAVMAVNAGDPDPRMVMVRVGDGGAGDTTIGESEETYDFPPWYKPNPGTYYYDNDYAWVGVDPASQSIWSDSVIGTLGRSGGNMSAPWDYRESYLITDPNDHSWVIDKYNFYTRDGTAGSQNLNNLQTKEGATSPADYPDGTPRSEHFPQAFGGELETIYEFPVWVVNVMGSPVFLPDDGNENCAALKDVMDTLAENSPCGQVSAPVVGYVPAPNAFTAWTTDDPCAGYAEPSSNGYCYGGQDATGGCAGFHGAPGNFCGYNLRPVDGNPNTCPNAERNVPLREYNALLYFKLQDLRVYGGQDKDHSVASTDTNGCAEEQVTWGPNPPLAAYDWQCPNGDDDAEGNSHPFHPQAVHSDQQPCPFYSGPTNHGGSTYVTPTTVAADDGWYKNNGAPCDYIHTTRDIDVYFSPGGRPFPPVIRTFDVTDLQGSSAPFNGYDGDPAGH